MKIITYNLNGIRSANKKGLLDFIKNENADIFCFQETRATKEQIEQELSGVQGYNLFVNESERKGYSGTAVLTKQQPLDYVEILKYVNFDNEGRLQVLDYGSFTLINLYTPNGNSRLQYKCDFIKLLINDLDLLIADGKELIVCTDFNISHNELDLSNPKECAQISGFLPEERQLFDDLLDIGIYDVYREMYPQKQRYTWSSYPSKRAGDKWGNLYTFDYIFATENVMHSVRNCKILHDVFCSDHYPVNAEIDISGLQYQ